MTQIFVDRAIERAKELDKYLKDTGRTYGPLHGLPISLKDQVRIKGLESTIGKGFPPSCFSLSEVATHTISGYTSWVGKYADDDAVLTKVLYACGAVPFVMTNVPQTLMVFSWRIEPGSDALTWPCSS